MKKINEIKFVEKLKAMPKKKLTVLLSVAAAIVIFLAVGITALCIALDRPDEDKTADVFGEMTDSDFLSDEGEETTTEQAAPSLEFKSNGDGTCVVTGLGTYTSDEVQIPAKSPDGDTVIGVSDEAFKGQTELISVTLSATVRFVGEGAFRGCSSLMAIYVSSENSLFTSTGGVLFSKDKSELICYPPARPGEKYLLHSNVVSVAPYAFEGVSELRALLYEGSTAKFQRIDIAEGNNLLYTIEITCNYVAAKPS